MRNDLSRSQNNEVRVSTAALVLDECHWRVRQMALPLIPQRRVKGALEVVSRETGISYSKTRKIFYRLTDHILAFERSNIGAAFTKALEKQERLAREQADRIATLRAECEALERQNELSLQVGRRDLGADQRVLSGTQMVPEAERATAPG